VNIRARIALSSAALGLALVANAAPAAAECDCLSLAVAADVGASIQAEVARADGLYVRGDFAAAAAAYAKAHAKAPDAELLYAQGVALWKAGDLENARASLKAYLAAGGTLAFRAQAQAALDNLDAGGGVVAGTTGAVGGVLGAVSGPVDDFAGAGVGTVGAVGGAGIGVVGGVTGQVDKPKPKRLAKGAAILLGVVAVGAVGAVGIHGIGAMADDVEFDTKFGLGLGLSGVVVGGTAIYLWGLTAATTATASAPCLADQKTLITPFATRDGGGLAAVGRF
jgi:hypothetical protein